MLEEIQGFAKQFDLDASALVALANGVISRVNSAFTKEQIAAMSREEQLTVVQMAVQHYFKCQEQFFIDLENNTNGVRDQLKNEVYNLLKETKCS